MTEHATASFVTALSSVPFESGDVLATTRQDYVSNQIQYLSLAERFGIEIVRVPDAPEGGVDLGAMEQVIQRRRPKLVAVTQIPTNSGLVQDVYAVGAMCRDLMFSIWWTDVSLSARCRSTLRHGRRFAHRGNTCVGHGGRVSSTFLIE